MNNSRTSLLVGALAASRSLVSAGWVRARDAEEVAPGGEEETPAEPAAAPDAGVEEETPDAGVAGETPVVAAEEEPVETGVEPWVPEAEEAADAAYEEALREAYEEALAYDDRPFGKGAMELGFGLGGWGGGGDFTLSVGAAFAYYVVNGLAPGLQIDYQTTFSDFEYPQSFTLLPFLKYVFYRSHSFSPFLVVAGGREFQWAGTDDPDKGYAAIGSWIAGGGPGVHIGFGRRFGLSIQVLFLYYFFDETAYVIDLGGDAEERDGMLVVPITIGFSFVF